MITLKLSPFAYYRAVPELDGVDKAGFQFAFLSQTLDASLMAREAAARLHFDEKSERESKKVYFRLSTGSVVISQATRLHERGSDNRSGQYLFHATSGLSSCPTTIRIQ